MDIPAVQPLVSITGLDLRAVNSGDKCVYKRLLRIMTSGM